jgi:hypothetical protein
MPADGLGRVGYIFKITRGSLVTAVATAAAVAAHADGGKLIQTGGKEGGLAVH